mgnify:CR=1 FL=1
MRAYELMLIINPNLDEEALEAVIEKAKGLITQGGGEITNVNKWGKRRLAYEIQDSTDGFYVVIDCNADNETTKEVDRVLKITEEVVRFLLVRKGDE